MKNRLYRSLADSFRLDFYLPESPLINPPAVTYAADANLAAVMALPTPPQAVLMDVTDALTVLAPDGSAVGTLDDCLRALNRRAYPILRFTSAEAGAAIAAYADANCLGDLTLCVPYADRALLPAVRAALPLSRGMLDCRGMTLPDGQLTPVGQCQAHDATMLLMDRLPSRAALRSLQKRFIQVWIDADPTDALFAGACGIITREPAALYALIARLPARSTVRPTPLYAHKGLHITEEFPENSIKAAVGAGMRGYDAAEIDITLTKDEVAIVQHDPTTKKLFDRDLTVTESIFAELSTLRRKGFPEDSLDRFDDLMVAMKAYRETPVLIELKTPAASFGTEELIAQMADLLARPDVQQYCTCIMGVKPPYLAYVHKHLPRLPLSHCVGKLGDPPTDTEGLNLMIYRFAEETKGANAGYNPDHPSISASFARIAHLRGITVFPWGWAFKPWETECAPLSAAFAAGYDGLTTDWVTKFADFPVDLIPTLPSRIPAGLPVAPTGKLLSRTGEKKDAYGLTIIPLSGDVTVRDDGLFTGSGRVKVALTYRGILPDGEPLCLCSEPATVEFA